MRTGPPLRRPGAPLAGCALALLAGCALDVVYPSGDSGDTAGGRTALTPTAPTAATPMWQGLQESFVDADGAPCNATVAAAMSEDAFCFVAADGDLWCAGRVHTTDFGASFVATGLRSARQVHLSHRMDGEDATAMCALDGGVLRCLGINPRGQLASGTPDANATFLPWGAVTDGVGAATGTWDDLCVLDAAGEAWCAGNLHGPTPARVGSGGALLVDPLGAVSLDDPDRWRASAGRSECVVTAEGLSCAGPLGDMGLPGVLGEPGHVVDGGMRGPEPFEACWLDDGGRASCGPSTSEAVQVFAEQPVLLLAVNGYTDALCAIHADGSVACLGRNTNGKLGTGALADLAVETQVAPPGTVDTRCR